jgi:hypothetical protein
VASEQELEEEDDEDEDEDEEEARKRMGRQSRSTDDPTCKLCSSLLLPWL